MFLRAPLLRGRKPVFPRVHQVPRARARRIACTREARAEGVGGVTAFTRSVDCGEVTLHRARRDRRSQRHQSVARSSTWKIINKRANPPDTFCPIRVRGFCFCFFYCFFGFNFLAVRSLISSHFFSASQAVRSRFRMSLARLRFARKRRI